MFPNNALVGQAMPDVARVRRPKLLFTWDNVMNRLFLVEFVLLLDFFWVFLVVQPPKSVV
jgi:hypothetical protein